MPALNTTDTLRVLLIDDHAVVRAGLRLLIESDRGLHIVGEAANTASALEATRDQQPDVILLDLDLNGDNGIDLLPQLLEVTNNHAKVILLTGLQDDVVHKEAVRRGAMGLVMKEHTADTLVKAIYKVYAGEMWLDRTMTASLFKELQGIAQPEADTERAKIESLTERERDVVLLIGEGLKNKEISERLFISPYTVRHHLTSVYAKLGLSDRLELLIYAYQHGLAQIPSR